MTERRLCFLLLVACLAATTSVQASELIVLNHLGRSVELSEPQKHNIESGETLALTLPENDESDTTVAVKDPSFSTSLPKDVGRYAVLVIQDDAVNLYDTNDLQVELSHAALECYNSDAKQLDFECMGRRTFQGMDQQHVTPAFYKLWSSLDYWKLCNHDEPAPTLWEIASKGGHTIEILRESPKIAAIRNFIPEERCREVMQHHAKVDKLKRARVGGSGETSTSEARETLTNNMDVNWSKDNALSRTAAATFDVASEILGQKIPYEAQEPINFLHYLKGFEYRPHTDGRNTKLGERVATTLIYCQIPDSGGGTVFTRSGMRFQPMNPGDLLYFEYQPEPYAAEHSACPVLAGEKSTFTQWHRLGVSADQPWWKFENWGEFHNPHSHTKWEGPRYYGDDVNEEKKEDDSEL